MKKIISLVLVAVLALTAIGGTLAYFADKEEVTNTFTLGNVNIKLEEPAWVEPETVIPGVAMAKDPTVTNIGNNAAWIRVDVILSDAAAFTAAAAAHNITDLETIFTVADDFDTKWKLAGVIEPTEQNDTLTYTYYYQQLLAVNASTGALFSKVTVPGAFTNEELAALDGDFTIKVVAHAIQDTDAFTTVDEAFAAYVEPNASVPNS